MPRHGSPAGRNAQIRIHVTEEEAERLRAYAAADDRSVSQVGRRAINQFLNENATPLEEAPRSKTRAGGRDVRSA